MYRFGIIGDDLRMKYLYASLIKDGYSARFGDTESADGIIEDCDIIVLPVNKQELLKKCIGKTVIGGFTGATPAGVKNYLTHQRYTVRNAYATAEGAISIAMKSVDDLLIDRQISITGFGNIGKALCDRLLRFGCSVNVFARSDRARAEAENMGARAYDFRTLPLISSDIIFNTVPATVITEATLASLQDDAVIIELASKPGGIDLDSAHAHGVTVISAQGLPGKYAPRFAGEILKEAVLDLAREE